MGRSLRAEDVICRSDPTRCNNLMMWHKYQEAGYVTAYSEDAVYMRGSFQYDKGFKVPPTDHYLRPVFLAGEDKKAHGVLCTGKTPSGRLTLDYVRHFAETYKNNRFFGYFWISSFSHESNQSPKEFDRPLLSFFRRLRKSGVLKNTFVFFFSDHGLRYGSATYPVESYYDDRLPMLFLWAPVTFRQRFPRKFANIKLNQHRFLSTYDIHLTLLDILASSKTGDTLPKLTLCPKCQSLFREFSGSRDCTDAGIPSQHCACRGMEKMSLSNIGAKKSLNKAVKHMHDLSLTIETRNCTTCSELVYRNLLRIHSFLDKRGRFYITAFTMVTKYDKEKRKSITFEVTLLKTKRKSEFVYEVLATKTLSEQKDIGYCAIEPEHRNICICKKVQNCTS